MTTDCPRVTQGYREYVHDPQRDILQRPDDDWGAHRASGAPIMEAGRLTRPAGGRAFLRQPGVRSSAGRPRRRAGLSRPRRWRPILRSWARSALEAAHRPRLRRHRLHDQADRRPIRHPDDYPEGFAMKPRGLARDPAGALSCVGEGSRPRGPPDARPGYHVPEIEAFPRPTCS
ncbi:hypothetical protein ACRAWD_29725 [Caulobacter segnis]